MRARSKWAGRSASVLCVSCLLALVSAAEAAGPDGAASGGGPFVSPYAKWRNGPPKDANYFPIATWLQPAKSAKDLQAAGVNLVIGIWQGPKEKDLEAFKAAGLSVICDQNDVGLAHRDDPLIVGWNQQDEPDNAQAVAGYWKNDAAAIAGAWPEANRPLKDWGTYGPPIPPKDIVARYNKMVAADPTRPVFLNLGQGVAYFNYNGRGSRRYGADDYMEYVKGCDIASFDLYAYSFPSPEVRGKIWLVPFGVDNLRGWGRGAKVVWNFVETTQVYKEGPKPTPAITRSEVWMSIIHGAQGIIYYAHGQGSEGGDTENAMVSDKEMMAALTSIDAQVKALAPAINSPARLEAAAWPADANVPVDCLAKRQGGAAYVFAAGMRPERTKAKVVVQGLPAQAKVEVLGEKRELSAKDGAFEDEFGPFEVHLYRIALGQ
jgi:hypothetical protein